LLNLYIKLKELRKFFSKGEHHLSEDKLEVEGIVLESSKGIFRVKLENDHVVIGHLSGKMKMYKIRVLPGDTVTIELSPYDLKRGRIVRREKVEE